jgi:putative addiction module component (TIGR02574 family)
MPDLIQELSKRANDLSPEDRARLAEELLESLGTGLAAEVDGAWDATLLRRMREVESGAVALVPAEDAFARARGSSE